MHLFIESCFSNVNIFSGSYARSIIFTPAPETTTVKLVETTDITSETTLSSDINLDKPVLHVHEEESLEKISPIKEETKEPKVSKNELVQKNEKSLNESKLSFTEAIIRLANNDDFAAQTSKSSSSSSSEPKEVTIQTTTMPAILSFSDEKSSTTDQSKTEEEQSETTTKLENSLEQSPTFVVDILEVPSSVSLAEEENQSDPKTEEPISTLNTPTNAQKQDQVLNQTLFTTVSDVTNDKIRFEHTLDESTTTEFNSESVTENTFETASDDFQTHLKDFDKKAKELSVTEPEKNNLKILTDNSLSTVTSFSILKEMLETTTYPSETTYVPSTEDNLNTVHLSGSQEPKLSTITEAVTVHGEILEPKFTTALVNEETTFNSIELKLQETTVTSDVTHLSETATTLGTSVNEIYSTEKTNEISNTVENSSTDQLGLRMIDLRASLRTDKL